jgi:hypothetical protein
VLGLPNDFIGQRQEMRMARKPTVLLEGRQLLALHGKPFQSGAVPLDIPAQRLSPAVATSRVLRLRGSGAETVNTNYELRYPIRDVVFRGALPIRILIGDLVAERERKDVWHIRRGRERLATGLPGLHEAVLAILTILDRELKRPAR